MDLFFLLYRLFCLDEKVGCTLTGVYAATKQPNGGEQSLFDTFLLELEV